MSTLTAPSRPTIQTSHAAFTQRLRDATRVDHARCERAVDLPLALSSVTQYARLLLTFGAFHRGVSAAIETAVAAAPRELGTALRRREARIAQDLRTLGSDDSEVRASRPVPGLGDLARQLGAWYVLEGSALGGLVIAHQVRHTLPAASSAVTFLSGDGASTLANWRRFQGFLDGHSRRMSIDFASARRGAELAFDSFVAVAVR